MRARAGLLAASLLIAALAGCASIPTYRIPLYERSRVFAYDAPTSIEAVKRVLTSYGFEISHVDARTGAIYTAFKDLRSRSTEVGGATRAQWSAMVESVPSGALISAQYLVEKHNAESWADSPVEVNKVRGLYVQLFRDIESALSD